MICFSTIAADGSNIVTSVSLSTMYWVLHTVPATLLVCPTVSAGNRSPVQPVLLLMWTRRRDGHGHLQRAVHGLKTLLSQHFTVSYYQYCMTEPHLIVMHCYKQVKFIVQLILNFKILIFENIFVFSIK